MEFVIPAVSRQRASRVFLLFLLGFLGLLTGCARVDAPQAAVCERVARILFTEGAVTRVSSEPDKSVPYGIVSRLTLRMESGGAVTHEVRCEFAGGAFSADRRVLTAVSTDTEGRLSDLHMAILRIVLARYPEGEGATPRPAGEPKALVNVPIGASGLYFLQLTLNGLTLGCVIALIAIGYTLVYSIIGAINFAFGELYMIGAFTALVGIALLLTLGLDPNFGSIILALPFAMALNAGYSWLTERMVFRPLRHANPLMPLIAAIGLSIVLQNYIFVAEGANDLWLPLSAHGGIALAQSGDFSLYLNKKQGILFTITALLVFATWFLLTRTAFGRAQRASSQDKIMAALVGIDIDRTIAATFALGGGLAAAGGLLVATYYGGVNFVMGFLMGFKALTAAIVGGMGNFAGALLGGFVVALVETFWAGYLQLEYKDIAVFSLLILLLVFRPHGLLGER